MPNFAYSAVGRDGQKKFGEYSAQDKAAVVTWLKEEQLFPVSVELLKEGAAAKKARGKVPMKMLAIFCTQMAVMMRVGVPISNTIDILSQQQENKILKSILEDVFENVNRGDSLSESFKKFAGVLPSFFLNMTEVGEESGTLDACLSRAGVFFDKIAKLNAKVKGAMIYPTIIVILIFGLLVLCLLWVLPAFAGMYGDTELPVLTQFLLDASEFTQQYWFIFLAVIIGIIVSFKVWVSTDEGKTKFDTIKFQIPVVGKLLKKVYAARFARTFASLSAVGVSMPHALEVSARSVLNRHMEKEIYKIVEDVTQGAVLSHQLQKMDLLPPLLVYMTRLGEESGTMDTLLLEAADFFDQESDDALTVLTSLMEPLLIVTMAAILLPILLAVLMPMFQMHEAMLG